MLTHKLQAILVFCFVLALQVYAETSSIEIDGKFVSTSFYSTDEVFTDFKVDLSTPTREKRAAQQHPLLFIGKLTLRETNGKATVIGVNATFNAEPVYDNKNDRESNRVTRDADDVSRLWLYGQFTLGDGPSAEVIRVRLNVNTSQPRIVPYTGSDVDRKTEIGFRGALTASNGHSNDVLDFSAHLGIRSKITPNREKREEIKTTLSLNGELTTEMTVPSSGIVHITTSHVNGDATIESKLASEGRSPYDQFLADESNPYQNYCELNGNLTAKVGGRKVFDVPWGANLLLGERRAKRDVEEEDEVIEVEYHGIFQFPHEKRGGHTERTRVSAIAKFWRISKG